MKAIHILTHSCEVESNKDVCMIKKIGKVPIVIDCKETLYFECSYEKEFLYNNPSFEKYIRAQLYNEITSNINKLSNQIITILPIEQRISYDYIIFTQKVLILDLNVEP
jgi:hypothetical protein